jgi:hypothetical protein
MKLRKSQKRRHGGRLRKLDFYDDVKRFAHWERTDRARKIAAKQKRVPGERSG